MNNLNFKNTSYDEILKEYNKINEFDDSIFLDPSLSELIGGKGKGKGDFFKKMKKAMKKLTKIDDDSDVDDSDVETYTKKEKKKKKKKKRKPDSDLDVETKIKMEKKKEKKRKTDLDLQYSDLQDSDLQDSDLQDSDLENLDDESKIRKIKKKILKLTKQLMEIKTKNMKKKGLTEINKFFDQLSQSGGNSDEYSNEKNKLIPLPRILPLSDVTSSEPVAYTQYGSSYSSSETPSYSSLSSSYSSSSYSSSETPSSLLSETPETQGVIGDISRGIEKLYKFLSK
jgi:hypothetical protein